MSPAHLNGVENEMRTLIQSHFSSSFKTSDDKSLFTSHLLSSIREKILFKSSVSNLNASYKSIVQGSLRPCDMEYHCLSSSFWDPNSDDVLIVEETYDGFIFQVILYSIATAYTTLSSSTTPPLEKSSTVLEK